MLKHIRWNDVAVEPLTAARSFLALAKKENPDLIFLGKQAIDDDANQTGQMLAALWERPQATYASKVEITGEKAAVGKAVEPLVVGYGAARHMRYRGSEPLLLHQCLFWFAPRTSEPRRRESLPQVSLLYCGAVPLPVGGRACLLW